MANVPIDSEKKQIIGVETQWNNEESSIQDDIVILTRDTDVWKKGKDLKRYRDLPVLLISPEYLDIYNKLSFLDTYGPDRLDRLAYLNRTTGKIARNDPLYIIEILKSGILDHNYFGRDLMIHGPDKARIASSIRLHIEGFVENQYTRIGNLKSKWIVSTGDVIESDSTDLIFNIPDDPSLLGTTITFLAYIIDPLVGITSKFVEKEISLFTNYSDQMGYVIGSKITPEDSNEIEIETVEWNIDDHHVNKRYVMTVNVNLTNDRNAISINVKSNKQDISIIQVPDFYNVFLVTYPDWIENTSVTFDIIVNDLFGNSDVLSITKNVSL